VHGEIKLNAFLWPQDNSVKIWNFGSGSRSLEQSLTSEGWRKTVQRNGANNFLQMLIYMSPEQTGRTTFQPDHRTDLYSLGITFFVALTQSLPFAHSSPMEIVHNVLNKKLPFVHEVRPETPVAISLIIEKLTNKVCKLKLNEVFANTNHKKKKNSLQMKDIQVLMV
jgi:serine/threonine protein kinase